MKTGIRTKLFLVSLAIIVVTVAALEAFLHRAIESALVDRIRQDLFVSASLVERSSARLVQEGPMAVGQPAWQQLARELGGTAHLRVTIIRKDGVVIADSEEDETGLHRMDNHATRAEVATALAGQRASSVRWSATLSERMMYVAVPLHIDGQLRGVVRISEPISDVDAAIDHLRRAIAVGTLAAVLLAILMSSGAALLMSRAIRQVTMAARAMAGGDLTVRTRMAGGDEIAELGRTLDQLAESLTRSLADLRSERDLLGRILDAMQEGVMVLDGAGRILLVNPALRDMLLLGPEVIGRPVIEMERSAELQEVLDAAAAADGPASGEVDIAGLKPRRLLVQAAPLAGEPRGMLVVFVDVTDIRRLEGMRRDFVANASHELRTPIAAVRSASETLRDAVQRDPPAALRFVEMVQRNAERLQALVDDLLELSRIESHQVRPRADVLQIAAAVEHTRAQLEERAGRKRITVHPELPDDCTARGDARALEHVLSNLLDNAIKYCPEGARVRIRATPVNDGKHWRLEVTDNGPGIEARHLPRLFERFYRADPGRSRDMGGTGLGLSIVKHLTEAMGGQVGVESAPGAGSTFWFTLPRA